MSKRPAMLASVIRGILAPHFLQVPPECGLASITEVEVSDDCSYATVYVTAMEDSKMLLSYLNARLSFFQHSVTKGLSRRRIPEIRFRIDERSERGNAIDRLLEGD